jgi:hypothetical protein
MSNSKEAFQKMLATLLVKAVPHTGVLREGTQLSGVKTELIQAQFPYRGVLEDLKHVVLAGRLAREEHLATRADIDQCVALVAYLQALIADRKRNQDEVQHLLKELVAIYKRLLEHKG